MKLDGQARIVEATVEALRPHAPFGSMAPEDLRWLASRLAVAYFSAGTEIAGPAGTADRLRIVKQGVVRGRPSAALPREESVDQVHGAGECFPIAALLAQRAPVYHYEAAGDVFVHELAEADFRALLERSSPFREFCTDYLSSLLEQSRAAFRAHAAAALADEARLRAPLRALLRRAPVSCLAQTPLGAVLRTMVDERVGSMVIVDDQSRPIGIFTEADVTRRVALAGVPVDTAVREVMTPNPVLLDAAAPAHEAALAMARHGIRHVVAVQDGRLAGVISERDLFSLQRASFHGVWDRLRGAASGEALAASAADLRQLLGQLLAQGVGAAQLTQMMAMLSDGVVQAAVKIAARRRRIGARYCWMALGSEGRMEQTLATDQDNAIVYESEEDRAELLALAGEVNALLDRSGYPLCKGDIMARNPEWCGSLAHWHALFAGWMENPHPEALLRAAIFFDLRAIDGEPQFVGELRDALLQRAARNRAFLRAMALNAIDSPAALGLLGDLVVEEEGPLRGTLNLKKAVLRPFVDTARVWALAHRVPATATAERLRAAAGAGALPAAEAESAAQAFAFAQGLRLRHQYFSRPAPGGENHVDPRALTPLDRRILREALRTAARLQQRLRLDYQL